MSGQKTLSIGKNIFLIHCLCSDVFPFYIMTLTKQWHGHVVRINLVALSLCPDIILSTTNPVFSQLSIKLTFLKIKIQSSFRGIISRHYYN